MRSKRADAARDVQNEVEAEFKVGVLVIAGFHARLGQFGHVRIRIGRDVGMECCYRRYFEAVFPLDFVKLWQYDIHV